MKIKILILALLVLVGVSSCKGCKWLKKNGCDTCGHVNADGPR